MFVSDLNSKPETNSLLILEKVNSGISSVTGNYPIDYFEGSLIFTDLYSNINPSFERSQLSYQRYDHIPITFAYYKQK